MKITKKLCSKIINWFRSFIILMESFNREKKVIPKKEIAKENKKDSKKYEYVYDYLENEVLNHNMNENDEEELSDAAKRYIKSIEAKKESRYRRGIL